MRPEVAIGESFDLFGQIETTAGISDIAFPIDAISDVENVNKRIETDVISDIENGGADDVLSPAAPAVAISPGSEIVADVDPVEAREQAEADTADETPSSSRPPRASRKLKVKKSESLAGLSQKEWADKVLGMAILFQETHKKLRESLTSYLSVLDAIIAVGTAKRVAYTRAREAAPTCDPLFGWMVRNPVMADHIALLNRSRVDIDSIPMLGSMPPHDPAQSTTG